MKTAIVILNWNGRHFLEMFLPGLIESVAAENASGQTDAEVIIADNASSDGSLELLSEKFPATRTIALDRNYGFTGGYNRALAQIDAQYYLLLNSDIEVHDGWLSPLVSWMDSHPGCGACAPKLLALHDRDRFEYAGAAGGFIDRFGYPFCRGRVLGMTEKDMGQYDSPACVLWGSGACLLVRTDLYRRLGGLDERFFAHQEEIDLCWRMQLEGYSVNTVPQSKVWHAGGGTLPNDSPWKLELNFRNNLLLLENNLAKTYALMIFSAGGVSAAEAAAKGLRRARRTMFAKMCLDGCSAAVYLLGLKFSKFRAVIKAHRGFRSLSAPPAEAQISKYLEENGRTACISGIYRGWIIPEAFLYGRKVFGKINGKMPQTVCGTKR